MLLKNFLNGAWVLKIVKITKLFIVLFIFRVLRLIWVHRSFSKHFSLSIFSLAWKIVFILFGTALTTTHSTANICKLYSSLTSWNNTHTGLIVVLKIWLAFFAAKMEVFFLSVFLILILIYLLFISGLIFYFCCLINLFFLIFFIELKNIFFLRLMLLNLLAIFLSRVLRYQRRFLVWHYN